MAPCFGGELPMRTLCGACTPGVAAPPPAPRASGDHLVGSGLGGRSRDAPPSRAPPSSPPRARDSMVSRRISAVAGELMPRPRSPVRREFGLLCAFGFGGSGLGVWFMFRVYVKFRGDHAGGEDLHGLGLTIQGLGFWISGFGCRASGAGLRASGFGCRASGFGLRVQGDRYLGPPTAPCCTDFPFSDFGAGASGSRCRGQGSGCRVPDET